MNKELYEYKTVEDNFVSSNNNKKLIEEGWVIENKGEWRLEDSIWRKYMTLKRPISKLKENNG